MTDTTMSNSKQNLFAMPSTASVAVAGRSRARRNIEWSPSDFIIGKSLGHGTFGSIYMARCCRRQYGGVRVALKRFSKTKILESAQRNAMRNAELLLEREISIHSRYVLTSVRDVLNHQRRQTVELLSHAFIQRPLIDCGTRTSSATTALSTPLAIFHWYSN